MSELRTFTQDDLDQLEELGRQQLTNAYKHGARQVNRFRSDLASGNADGMKGEWAVQESYGMPRTVNISGRSDAGYDLRGPLDHTIQVRFTRYYYGRMMCPASHPMKADAAVLAVAGHLRTQVWIVGGVWVADFYRQCHRRDFGYGLTDYLEQRQLVPWETFKELL